jgi:nitroreductase
METLECIKSRASVRKFRKEELPEEDLTACLEAGIAAPSAGNCQDWGFVLVRNQETKSRLAVAAFGQEMLEDAPVVIVVCSDRKKIGGYGTRGETLYTIQDSAAAAQNIMLAAWDKEIGSCWVGGFDEQEVSKILALPSHVRPAVIMPLGYPVEKPEKPRRWPLKDFVHDERF